MMRMLMVAGLLVVLAGLMGCATTSARRGHGRDVHASASVSGGGGGRLVVQGPAVLLHLSVEGENDVSLYTVPAGDGARPNCAAGADGTGTAIRRGASNRVNLRVATGEAVCIASPAASGRAEVRWHAKKLDPALGNGEMVAFDDVHR